MIVYTLLLCLVGSIGVCVSRRNPNQAAVDMVKKFEFENAFDVVRMHVNGDPNELKPEVFCLTSIDVCGF